jgi:hypothetical protein
LCFSNWRQSELPTQQNWPHLTFVKHFLLDAVFHSNTSTVEVLTSIILTWPMSLRKQFWSITNTSDGPAKGALEMAFLSNSHHLMNLLTSAGWKASVSLKTSLLYGPNLREAFESSNFEMIRCLLKIFGATDSSLSDIKYRLCGPIDRPSANAKALRFAVASVAKEVGSIAPIHYSPPVRSHWIWTVENASFQDHIDIILAAGAKPWPVQVSFLLWEAIVSNRPGRLDILLKNGVRIRRQPHYLTAKHVQAMAGIQAGSLAIFSGEAWISPLCCAIFHKRYRMIESLFTAGASVNEPGSNLGLAPIHFAAISDSVEAFKCLERHGADLEATDLQGRNIMDFLLSARHTFSLYDHLVTYRDSYSQCSWGPHLFP